MGCFSLFVVTSFKDRRSRCIRLWSQNIVWDAPASIKHRDLKVREAKGEVCLSLGSFPSKSQFQTSCFFHCGEKTLSALQQLFLFEYFQFHLWKIFLSILIHQSSFRRFLPLLLDSLCTPYVCQPLCSEWCWCDSHGGLNVQNACPFPLKLFVKIKIILSEMGEICLSMKWPSTHQKSCSFWPLLK